jgi:hypothetical protein
MFAGLFIVMAGSSGSAERTSAASVTTPRRSARHHPSTSTLVDGVGARLPPCLVDVTSE